MIWTGTPCRDVVSAVQAALPGGLYHTGFRHWVFYIILPFWADCKFSCQSQQIQAEPDSDEIQENLYTAFLNLSLEAIKHG